MNFFRPVLALFDIRVLNQMIPGEFYDFRSTIVSELDHGETPLSKDG